jgi:hypothetical protein
MKTKEGYLLREVAHQYIVVPIGETALNFNGVITLNKTAAFLWKHLQKGCREETLVSRLVEKYSISIEIAQTDVKDFLNKMRDHSLLEEHE